MIAEPLSRTQDLELGLTTSVRCLDLRFPKSAAGMKAVLIRHAIECRHCLAMVLFRQETLAEVGCETYKHLVADMNSVLRVRTRLRSGAHIDEEALEEYCFNRLGQEDSRRVEEHFASCPECAEKLEHRMEFIAVMKSALQMLEDEGASEDLGGAFAVHCPDRQLNVYGRVGS